MSVTYAVLLSVTMLNYSYCIHRCLAESKEGNNSHPCEATQTISITVEDAAAPTIFKVDGFLRAQAIFSFWLYSVILAIYTQRC